MKEMHNAPIINISINLGPPAGKSGKKGQEEAKARKAIAKKKVEKSKKKDEDEEE